MTAAQLEKTFHRRELPCPPAICAFSSEQGRRIMKEALMAGTAEGSYKLLEQFHTQNEPAYCGLGTLVMTLNALDIDPRRIWKGAWRWFSEDLLDCCEPLEIIQRQGIPFEKFVCLARCNGAMVKAHRPDDAEESLENFRQNLRAAVSDADGPVFVVAYSRKTFGQTGDGHYSPIAAYHEELDAALILDVARFKLPPHWVPVQLLWESLKEHDPGTKRCRGYALISRNPDYLKNQSACCGGSLTGYILSFSAPAWHVLGNVLSSAKATICNSTIQKSSDVVDILCYHIKCFGGLVRESELMCVEQNESLIELQQQVLNQLATTDIGFAAAWPSCGTSDSTTAFAADVLALPPPLWLPTSLLDSPVTKFLDISEMPIRLSAEMSRLRQLVTNVSAGWDPIDST